MSKLTRYIKRGIKYIISGQPIQNVVVTPKIVTIAPNELLQGRTAFVTGGTSGIGKAIVEAFLNAGANVVFTTRSQERGDKIASEFCQEFPDRLVVAVEMDNSKPDTFAEVLDNVLSMIGQNNISILVNNAGINGGRIGNATEEEFDNIISTNLKGVFFLSELVSKYMKNNGIQGNILNICSSSSLRPAISAYALSKWGLRGFTLGLAKSLISYNIVVNGIAPGPTATPMQGNAENLADMNIPNGRMTTPEEIANMAVVFVSNMGRSIVGDILYMCGGSAVLTYDDNYSYDFN